MIGLCNSMAAALGSTTDKLSKLDINSDWASHAPNLQKNLSLLSTDQVTLYLYACSGFMIN